MSEVKRNLPSSQAGRAPCELPSPLNFQSVTVGVLSPPLPAFSLHALLTSLPSWISRYNPSRKEKTK